MKAQHAKWQYGWSVVLWPGSPAVSPEEEQDPLEVDYTQLPDVETWCIRQPFSRDSITVFPWMAEVPDGLVYNHETELVFNIHAPDTTTALQQAELFVEALSKVLPTVQYITFGVGNTKCAAKVVLEDAPNEQEYLV